MVSSAPASSETRQPAPPARADGDHPSALVRLLVTPAAFFASNWATLLLFPTVVGTLPALVATTRTTGDLEAHGDRAFRETLRAGTRLVRRDGPISLLMWVLILLAAGDAAILALVAEGGIRVFLVGAALPPLWVAASLLSAYVVVAAQDPAASRSAVVRDALALAMRRPGRALLAPAMILALSPLWLLAPITIAIGFSLPPHVLARVWGPAPQSSGPVLTG